jgi:hypothetical protein
MTAICADLIGDSQAIAAGITVSGRYCPVLALCRALVEAGHDPESRVLRPALSSPCPLGWRRRSIFYNRMNR